MAKPVVLTTPSEREISWIREFRAPRKLVFEALTRPELIRRWMLGPPGWTMTECSVDLRVGGSYRWSWTHAEQGTMAMVGVYREVAAPDRIVSTERYDFPGNEEEAVGTVILTETAGRTVVQTTMLYSSPAARDAALQSGMDAGMAASYARLDGVLRRRWPQSASALVGGFAVVAVLSTVTDAALEAARIFPPLDRPQDTTDGMLAVALAYRTVYTVLGFFLTALWAPRAPRAHALGLGVFGTVVAGAGVVAMWSFGHQWYSILLAALTLPCAWLGAFLHSRLFQKESHRA